MGEKFTQISLKGLEWYRDQMPPTSPSEIALEKSPSYFVTPSVPKRGEKIIYVPLKINNCRPHRI